MCTGGFIKTNSSFVLACLLFSVFFLFLNYYFLFIHVVFYQYNKAGVMQFPSTKGVAVFFLSAESCSSGFLLYFPSVSTTCKHHDIRVVKGNEEADYPAKQALNNSQIDIVTLSDIK